LGNETKNFDVRDGHGIKILKRCGIETIFFTGRTSKVVEHRARDLEVTEVYQGIKNKSAAIEDIMNKKGLSYENIAYMGDDIVDIPVLKKAGFSATVADACEYAKEAVDYVATKKGGQGAVREVCEIIIKSQGRWGEVVLRYNI
jgi:3-deoxy-D-manno-octulosonate 8-phosphate phosphatase (KDO 8-P phosphatase)